LTLFPAMIASLLIRPI